MITDAMMSSYTERVWLFSLLGYLPDDGLHDRFYLCRSHKLKPLLSPSPIEGGKKISPSVVTKIR